MKSLSFNISESSNLHIIAQFKSFFQFPEDTTFKGGVMTGRGSYKMCCFIKKAQASHKDNKINWTLCSPVTCTWRMYICLFGFNKLDLLHYVHFWVCVLCLKISAPLLWAYPRAVGLTGVCFLISAQQLFQKLKNLMRPYSVEFESPLELSAQGESSQTLKKMLIIRTHAFEMP